MKVKIYEIAKKMGVDNKQVVEIANKNGIEVKSHLSSVTEEEGKMLEKLLKGVFKKKSMENQKEKDEPVIIRRAVIFNDDDKNEFSVPKWYETFTFKDGSTDKVATFNSETDTWDITDKS